MARERELIEPNPGDKRYIRRDEQGHFTEDQVDMGRSISQDMRRESTTKAEKGHGDKGDHNPKKE
jgi:hypothetical protein